jgi:hypothetical protein
MTLEAFLVEISRIDDQFREMAAPLSAAQTHWQPEGGRRWSIVQNIQHLARTNALYVAAMRAGLARAKPVSDRGRDLSAVPSRWGRWFIGVMEPPPRFRVRTRAIVQPTPAGSAEEALAALVASHDDLRALARDLEGRDLAATFTSPFGPLRFRLATGILVLAAHDRRHLWQARQVVNAPGFPLP